MQNLKVDSGNYRGQEYSFALSVNLRVYTVHVCSKNKPGYGAGITIRNHYLMN